jgi:hypothetical protein
VIPPAPQSTRARHVDLLDEAARGIKHGFMTPHTLDGMAILVAVAEAKSFRVAG